MKFSNNHEINNKNYFELSKITNHFHLHQPVNEIEMDTLCNVGINMLYILKFIHLDVVKYFPTSTIIFILSNLGILIEPLE